MNVVKEKSFQFVLDIVSLCRVLRQNREFIFADQLLRSGTSVGANIEEAQAAQSRKDFISKMAIASKEARESNYWLRLIIHTCILADVRFAEQLLCQCQEIVSLLTAIVKKTQNNF